MKKLISLFLILLMLAGCLATASGEPADDPKTAIVGTWYNTMILASLEEGGELPPVGSGFTDWVIIVNKNGTFKSTRFNIEKQKKETHKGKWKYDKANNQYQLNDKNWKKKGLNIFWLEGGRLMLLGARPGVKNIPTVFEREKRELTVLNPVGADANAFIGHWVIDKLDYNGFMMDMEGAGLNFYNIYLTIEDGTAVYESKDHDGKDVVIHYTTSFEDNKLLMTPADEDPVDPNSYFYEILEDGGIRIITSEEGLFFVGHRADGDM